MVLLLSILVVLVLGVFFSWRPVGNDVWGESSAEDSVSSGPNPQIRIFNPRGSIRVEGAEGLGSIELETTRYALGPDAEKARLRASEVSGTISREGPREAPEFVVRANGGRNTGAEYTLQVPSGSSVEAETGTGDASVKGLKGNVEIRTESGDVTVSEILHSVAVEVSQGDVSVSDVRTDTGQVEVDVGVGDTEVEDLVVGTLDVRANAGDTVLSGRFSGDGEVLVQTGDIVVGTPPQDVAELELEARVGDVVRKESR